VLKSEDNVNKAKKSAEPERRIAMEITADAHDSEEQET
jgi:hypothetical protein